MPMYEFKDNFFESEEMYNLLKSFYKYGFIIIKKVPTIDNFIVNRDCSLTIAFNSCLFIIILFIIPLIDGVSSNSTVL